MRPKALESEHAIREHLSVLLSSTAFAHVDRLKRFLRYVVEETVAGRSENLKEYSVGVEVFDREASFDPRTDPIVRVQARRLRARLTRYYEEEGRHEEIRIELPKGGYAPLFHRRGAPGLKRTVATALASRNTIPVLPFANPEMRSASLSNSWMPRMGRIFGRKPSTAGQATCSAHKKKLPRRFWEKSKRT